VDFHFNQSVRLYSVQCYSTDGGKNPQTKKEQSCLELNKCLQLLFYENICLHVVQTGSGVHATSYPMGIGGNLSPGVKWPGREADQTPPTSAEVKKIWSHTSTPPYDFMA
jgi:hypothetical protein